MDRVFLRNFDGKIIADKDISHQLRRVLRLRKGDTFIGASGRREWTLEVDAMGREGVRVRVVEEREAAPRGPRVVAAQALLKKPRWELFLEKATELGAAEIVPVAAARCVARPRDYDAEKAARWRRITERAAAQCHGAPPKIHAPAPLERWLAQADATAHRWVCSTDTGATPILTALEDAGSPASVTLLVGPEGDFTPEENERIRASGFAAVSLGPRVLRAETAAVAALAAVMLKINYYSERNILPIP